MNKYYEELRVSDRSEWLRIFDGWKAELEKKSLLDQLVESRRMKSAALAISNSMPSPYGSNKLGIANLAHRCRMARERLHMSQLQMAMELDMSLPLYRTIEQGKKDWLRSREVDALLRIEKVSVDYSSA
jgi:ribosome-binding protein aMBF1 (putative translation factor)